MSQERNLIPINVDEIPEFLPQYNHIHNPYYFAYADYYNRYVDIPIIACNYNYYNADMDMGTITENDNSADLEPETTIKEIEPAESPPRSDEKSDNSLTIALLSSITIPTKFPEPKKKNDDSTSRYWSFLYDNLERSFSEILDICIRDEDFYHSKEIVSFLEKQLEKFRKVAESRQRKTTEPQGKRSKVDKNVPSEPNSLRQSPIMKMSSELSIECIETIDLKANDSESPNVSSFIFRHEKFIQQALERIHKAIQTDIEDDPDIYYFAGGRHIASQTDPTDEYKTITKLTSVSKVIIVRASESDMDLSMNSSDTFEPFRNEDCEMTRSVETKTSATQLSFGVNFGETKTIIPKNDKGKGEGIPQGKSETLIANHKEMNGEKDQIYPGMYPSTFADKAKNGLFTTNVNNDRTKSYPSNLNLICNSSSSKCLTGKNKTKIQSVNYRSNIASRCRTAYVQQQTVNNKAKSFASSFTSSSGSPKVSLWSGLSGPSPRKHSSLDTSSSKPTNTSSPASQIKVGFGVKVGVMRSKSAINPIAASACAKKLRKFDGPLSHEDSFLSLPDESTRRKQSNVDADGWETVRTRSNRSKWSQSNSSLVSSNSRKGSLEQKQKGNGDANTENEIVEQLEKEQIVESKQNLNQMTLQLSATSTSLPTLMGTFNEIKIIGIESDIMQNKTNPDLSINKDYINEVINNTKEVKNETIDKTKIKEVKEIPNPSGETLKEPNHEVENQDDEILTISIEIEPPPEIINKQTIVNEIPENSSLCTSVELELTPELTSSTISSGKSLTESQELTLSLSVSESVDDSENFDPNEPKNEETECSSPEPIVVEGIGVRKIKEIRNNFIEIKKKNEEIQMKEEALESAMREEDLLEEELLQMEKDFEEMENETTNGKDEVTIAVTENDVVLSPSPEILEIDFETADQVFFISMNDRVEELRPKEQERLVNLREKLMSPARKLDSAETLKRHRAKLAKAETNREKLLESKFIKYVELTERFSSLNKTTKRLMRERRILVAKAEERRKRAMEKRTNVIKKIRAKAHDEDSKVREIAFINFHDSLNRKFDLMASEQGAAERLIIIHEERRRKLEERASKVAGVIQRQHHIRNDWQNKLQIIQEKRKKTEARITREKEEKAKERTELALEKARDRQEKRRNVNAAKQARIEDIKKKMDYKQTESERRHKECIDNIQRKANVLGAPRSQEDTATVRMCTLCKVTLASEVLELAHLRGRSHLEAIRRAEKDSGTESEEYGFKFITDVSIDKIDPGILNDKNRFKSLKKHCKKIFNKLLLNGEAFENDEKTKPLGNEKSWGDSSLKNKVGKNIREAERLIGLINTQKGCNTTVTNLDRILREVRQLTNKNKFIQEAFIGLGAFKMAQKIIDCTAPDLPQKIIISACNVITAGIYENMRNTFYALRGTIVCSIVDLIATRWALLVPDGNRWHCGSPVGSDESMPCDSVLESCLELVFTVFNVIPDPIDGICSQNCRHLVNETDLLDILTRTQDFIGYFVSTGVIDRLSVYSSSVRGPLENQPTVAGTLKFSFDFFTMIVYALSFCAAKKAHLTGKKENDSTQLLASFETSDLAGSISMSYSLLIYQGGPSRPRLLQMSDGKENIEGGKIPEKPGNITADIVLSTLSFINSLATHDIKYLQKVLGSESLSLQFRHIASQLLWQVVPYRKEPLMKKLLKELIIAIGNFTVANKHNQSTIQSGQTPTVLQQLCNLPKEFFQDPSMSRTLYSTLIAVSHGNEENREIINQSNIKTELLDSFVKSPTFNKTNRILRYINQNQGIGLTL